MMLYIYTILLLVGLSSFFSGYFRNLSSEIFLGLGAPILIGFTMIFHKIKYSKSKYPSSNKILIRELGIKFTFYGLYIISIFFVYPFKPLPFMCSFATSFTVLHIAEAIILKKIKSV